MNVSVQEKYARDQNGFELRQNVSEASQFLKTCTNILITVNTCLGKLGKGSKTKWTSNSVATPKLQSKLKLSETRFASLCLALGNGQYLGKLLCQTQEKKVFFIIIMRTRRR